MILKYWDMKTFLLILRLIFFKNGYFHNIVQIHIRYFSKASNLFLKILPKRYIWIMLKILHPTLKFGFNNEKNLFSIKENGHIHFFSSPKRGRWLYGKGLKQRGVEIAESYGIHLINFKKNDKVVDIGANYGDLTIFLNKFSNIDYFAFEPDPEAFKSLIENSISENNFKIAISDFSGKTFFYLDPDLADSSLVHKSNCQKIEVNVSTIDDIFTGQNIKLLKVETEGKELEVLNGSLNTLSKVEFVAIDGGTENNNESTLGQCANLLQSFNFELIFLGTKGHLLTGRALFKNKNFN